MYCDEGRGETDDSEEFTESTESTEDNSSNGTQEVNNSFHYGQVTMRRQPSSGHNFEQVKNGHNNFEQVNNSNNFEQVIELTEDMERFDTLVEEADSAVMNTRCMWTVAGIYGPLLLG